MIFLNAGDDYYNDGNVGGAMIMSMTRSGKYKECISYSRFRFINIVVNFDYFHFKINLHVSRISLKRSIGVGVTHIHTLM